MASVSIRKVKVNNLYRAAVPSSPWATLEQASTDTEPKPTTRSCFWANNLSLFDLQLARGNYMHLQLFMSESQETFVACWKARYSALYLIT